MASNRTLFGQLPHIQTQVLELAAAVATAEHYESFGYKIDFQHPKGRPEFVVKVSSRGYPWNYSRIQVKRDGEEFEIHTNLSVRGAHDFGIYCVDIAVTHSGIVPKETPKTQWLCLPNSNLITFAEAKKLIVYPMLLAHFIGIVHELTPSFLSGVSDAFESANHFAPALVTLGHCTANSREIIATYSTRHISVNVEANFDVRFSDSLTKFRFGQSNVATV